MNFGEEYEYALVNFLNEKKFSEIDVAHQKIIKALFPYVIDDSYIKCEKVFGYLKPDIKITIEDKVYYLSVKMGRSNRFHTEKYDSFLTFLRNNLVSEESVQFFNSYLFLKTRPNSGDIYAYLRKHKMDVTVFNDEMESREMKIAMFLRCIVQGVDPEQIKVNFMLIRKETKIYLVPVRELFHYFEKQYIYGKQSFYCGPLSLKAWSRNFERLEQNGKTQCVTIQWDHFEQTLDKLDKFII